MAEQWDWGSAERVPGVDEACQSAVTIHLYREQIDLIARAAEHSGTRVAQWVADIALAAAERTIRERSEKLRQLQSEADRWQQVMDQQKKELTESEAGLERVKSRISELDCEMRQANKSTVTNPAPWDWRTGHERIDAIDFGAGDRF